MKPLFKLLIVTIYACFAFSCNKDQAVPRNEDSFSKTVKKVSSTPSDFVSYEYDVKGNVTKSVSQWQAGGSINRLTNIFEYDANNRLVKWSNEAGYGNFTYTNGKLQKSEHYAVNGRKISTYLYTFNGEKLTDILEQIANPLPDGAKETKITYQYYDNGNLERMDFSHRIQLSDPFTVNFSKVYVEYDNKKNPEPDGVAGFYLPGVILQKNNPLRVNNILQDGTTGGHSRYEYKYNFLGLPAERKQFITTNGVESAPITFQYVY